MDTSHCINGPLIPCMHFRAAIEAYYLTAKYSECWWVVILQVLPLSICAQSLQNDAKMWNYSVNVSVTGYLITWKNVSADRRLYTSQQLAISQWHLSSSPRTALERLRNVYSCWTGVVPVYASSCFPWHCVRIGPLSTTHRVLCFQ